MDHFVVRDDVDGKAVYRLSEPSRTIGRVRSFFGNVGILLRGYAYLRTLGAAGLNRAGRRAMRRETTDGKTVTVSHEW